MKTFNFPYIALGIGMFLMLVVVKGSEAGSDGVKALPLLTLLFISEFAVIVTAVGAYIGIKNIQSVGIRPVYTFITILCVLLSVRFMALGIDLWSY